MKTLSYPWLLSSILENGSLISILETVFSQLTLMIKLKLAMSCEIAAFAILAIFVWSGEIVYDVK